MDKANKKWANSPSSQPKIRFLGVFPLVLVLINSSAQTNFVKSHEGVKRTLGWANNEKTIIFYIDISIAKFFKK